MLQHVFRRTSFFSCISSLSLSLSLFLSGALYLEASLLFLRQIWKFSIRFFLLLAALRLRQEIHDRVVLLDLCDEERHQTHLEDDRKKIELIILILLEFFGNFDAAGKYVRIHT